MESKRDEYWKETLENSQFFPAPEASPVCFSYLDRGSTLTVPYHVVGPLAWEYPYHCGQPQEDLSDRLVPASLYGVKVVRPGYLSAYHGPATAVQAKATCDSRKGYRDHISNTDVDKNARTVREAGQGHQNKALFICPQPECMVAGGQSFLFATLEQWAAHWNTFYVAVDPLFHCMERVVIINGLTH